MKKKIKKKPLKNRLEKKKINKIYKTDTKHIFLYLVSISFSCNIVIFSFFAFNQRCRVFCGKKAFSWPDISTV